MNMSKEPSDAWDILGKIEAAGHAAYLAGECVRVISFGATPRRYEIVAAATQDEVLQAVGNGYAVEKHKDGMVRISTADAPLITVVPVGPSENGSGSGIVEALAHNAFTVDAIGVNGAGEILDPFCGVSDLQNGMISTIEDPFSAIASDPLLSLVAARLASTYERFTIEPTLLDAMACSDLIPLVDWPDIRDEFMAGLSTEFPDVYAMLLMETGLLTEIIPDILDINGLEQDCYKGTVFEHTLEAMRIGTDASKSDPVYQLAILLHDVGKGLMQGFDVAGRLRFPRHDTAGAFMARGVCDDLLLSEENTLLVTNAVRWHMMRVTDAKSAKEFVRAHPSPLSALFTARVITANRATSRKELYDEIWEEWLKSARLIRGATDITSRGTLQIDGNDVMHVLSIGEGPQVGSVLGAIMAEVLDGSIPNKRDALLAALPRFASDPVSVVGDGV